VDSVIRCLSSAGLKLSASLPFIADPVARGCVTGAIDQLDQAVKDVRSTVVGQLDQVRSGAVRR
jgi:hypothetical protein